MNNEHSKLYVGRIGWMDWIGLDISQTSIAARASLNRAVLTKTRSFLCEKEIHLNRDFPSILLYSEEIGSTSGPHSRQVYCLIDKDSLV